LFDTARQRVISTGQIDAAEGETWIVKQPAVFAMPGGQSSIAIASGGTDCVLKGKSMTALEKN
jgi:hypothetical protein